MTLNNGVTIERGCTWVRRKRTEKRCKFDSVASNCCRSCFCHEMNTKSCKSEGLGRSKKSNKRHKYIMKEGKDVRKLQKSYEKAKYLSIQNAHSRFKEIFDQEDG